MKRLILCLFLSMLFCSCIQGSEDEGFRFWGLNEKSFDSESTVIGRIGYEMDDFFLREPNNSVEVFVGTTWIPEMNGEEGKVDPPTTMSLGVIYHFSDLIDANNPLPWIDDALLSVIPEEVSARPYIGGQGTFTFVDDDGGLYSGMIGVLAKVKEDAAWDMVFELTYNNLIYELATVPYDDEFVMSAGIRIGF